jgi:photosystem II stability/assembly factor-like uncharacterized protein
MKPYRLTAAIICLAAGCGGRNVAPDPSVDVLAAVPCAAWRPSDADWSSLPASRPAILGTLSASPSGKYLYSVGTWFDAGAPRRQILRSPDLGETWCVLPTPDPVSIVVPSRASETVLYAVTCTPAATSPHLLKTNDGGATWTAAAAALPEVFYDCSGASSPLETSFTDPAAVWLKPFDSNPLYLSGDGGESWASVPSPPPLMASADMPFVVLGGVDGLLVDPSSSGRMLAWGSTPTAGTTLGPERWFTSRDAGATWREIAAPPPTGISPSAIRVFADVGSSLYASGGRVLLRSDNWGETWTIAGPLPDPLATVTTLGARKPGWRSIDGGSSWSALDVPLDPAIDPVLAPDGGDVVVGLGDLWMSATTNGGKTWTPRPLVPASTGLAQSPIDLRIWADSYHQVTRRQSNPLLLSADGGSTWTIGGEPSGVLLMDGASANAAFSGVYDGSGGPERTEDGGKTWVPFSVATGSIDATATCPPPHSCLYVLSTTQTTPRLSCALSRSDDRGRTWTAAQPVPPELCYGYPMAVAPDGPEHLLFSCLPWSGSGDISSVCESRDGGQSWTSHPIGTDPDRPVTSVVFTASGVALAATLTFPPPGNTNSSVTARSADGGSTWSEVLREGGRLVASAAQPDTVFLISDRDSSSSSYSYSAVFRSDDSGATWRLISPPAETTDNPGFRISAIADAPGGGFIAATVYGLVKFK